MEEHKIQVSILAHTPLPTSVIYAAFRQCYSKDNAEDILKKSEYQEVKHKFIKECVESGHLSPLEHVNISFSIQGASRALTHQLVRHRIASYSQQSQRYIDGRHFGFVIPPAIQRNSKALKSYVDFMKVVSTAYNDIKEILEADGRGELAKEDARMVLPQSTTSNIIVTMNCRALLNFFSHRCCSRAQWEIRNMANQMLSLCKDTVPAVFEYAGAKCEKLGYCPEGEKFCCGRYMAKKG